jgi:hypothetical protein
MHFAGNVIFCNALPSGEYLIKEWSIHIAIHRLPWTLYDVRVRIP